MYWPSGLSLCTLLLCGCPAPDEGRAFSSEDEAAIRRVLTTQVDAWNRGDVEGFMASGYQNGDDLIFTSGGTIRRGYATTLERYRSRYAARNEMGTLAFSDLEVTGLGPTGALVLGRFQLTDTPAAGGGVFTLAFLKTAKGWRIIHDHTSADPPPSIEAANPPDRP